MKDEILKKAISDYFKTASFKLVPSEGGPSVEIEIESEEPEMEDEMEKKPMSMPEKLMKGMK